ncbi:hypothetical protein K470DRAFT_259259 [Piedraia hortae CBS 480.64]|uniref:Bax inhibitor family protein n=1 Tax=Piedraia hortae CBS 480.64 TaxID=1314780 RepID=A0A6A7BV65_9PEZI|nr:hypothetical protein K470DRAFT_259259 [Piedraia hortae CBS 480.64]
MAFATMTPLFRCPLASVPSIARASAQPFCARPVQRGFRTTAKQFTTPLQQLSKARQGTLRNHFTHSGRRGYQVVSQNPIQSGSTSSRLLYGGALFGGTLLAINLVFNRETREDGGMPPFERSYLNQTFLHTGLGVGIIGVAASALHRSGWSFRLMAANPWLVMGAGLVGSIGSMMACQMTPPENYMVKYGLFATFNLTQAALLSPLFFFSPALLAKAGLYTVGMMGSIAVVGATAKQEKYLYLGAPLLAGVAVVALSGLAPLVLPTTAGRALMWSQNIFLYGGLAVFGGFTLYDVQKVLQHARMAERGLIKRDYVNESISLELDFINIFTRMVYILAMQQGQRRR